MPTRFALLPHARTQVLSRSLGAGASGRRHIDLSVEVRGDGVAEGPRIAITGDLLGPGDVLSVDRATISRIEPVPGLVGFEPNYMPFVEFVDADFPWRFTLADGAARGINPWIVLIVLDAEEFVYVDAPSGALPRIEVKNVSQSLPELAQSWAFAHVHCALPESGGSVESSMTSSAANHFARLLCPRRLQERRAYTMLLVPAYEAGRLAGLGLKDAPETPDQPAWDVSSTSSILLPLYFQSRFITNAMEDVEELIRRLKPISPDAEVRPGSARRVSAADPGYYPNYSAPGAGFLVQSALQPLGTAPAVLETDPVLIDLVRGTLGEVIAGETGASDSDDNDPLVAIPPYGFRFRPDGAPTRARAEQGRAYDLINLDLKFRHAASLGVETVRQNQEYFAKLCWEQYEDVVEANQRIARLRAAKALGDRLIEKHAAKIAPDTLLTLAESLQPFVLTSESQPIADVLRASGIPTSFATRSLRRAAARRPVATGPADNVVTVTPAPSLPGDRTSNPATAAMQRDRFERPDRVSRPVRGLAFGIESGMRAMIAPERFANLVRPLAAPVAARAFESRAVGAELLETLARLPHAKATFVIQGLRPQEQEAMSGIYRSPVVTVPLATRLAAFAPDAILSNASTLEPNTVAVFEENRMFLEAYLVGANHEMNKELRWREFPTDMRGTIFPRFWDRGRPPDDAAGDDIPPIHTWDATLGRHFAPGDIDHAANLVVVLRSDLVRKLVMPILVINEAESATWEKDKGINHEPVFFGTLGPDVAYYGFDVGREHIVETVRDRAFLLIYEPPGRVRFGLDIATVAVRQARRDTKAESQRFPVRALQRDERLVLMHSRAPQPVPLVLQSWDELSWTHMTLSTSGYVDFAPNVVVAGQPDYFGAAKTSASVARAFWQKPVAAVMPLPRVL